MSTSVRSVLCLASFLIVLSAVFGQEQESREITALERELWSIKRRDGLITEEEYQHVLRTGRLAWQTSQLSVETTTHRERFKREYRKLDTESRRSEARQRLQNLSRGCAAVERYDSGKTKALARQKDWPVEGQSQDGTAFEIISVSPDGKPVYHTTATDDAADTISTDEVHPGSTNGFSLTGQGVTFAIWDLYGPRTTHQEFSVERVTKGESTSTYHHPTAVASIMVASGVDSRAKGMAPSASLVAYHWADHLEEMAAQAAEGLQLSNHSYAEQLGWWYDFSANRWYWEGDISVNEYEDYQFGWYGDLATNVDNTAYTASYYLPVWAAGNARNEWPQPVTQPKIHRAWNGSIGSFVETNLIHAVDGEGDYDSLHSYAVAKNVLTVGNITDITGGYAGMGSVVMTDSSGWGPTDDGRIKPDLVANGYGVYCANDNSDTDYFERDGTSMATPGITGSLGLFVELNWSLHGTNSFLLASTLKGLAIHNADEAGGTPGPDYSFGWGLMNTLKAARLMTNNAAWNSKPHIKEVLLPSGEWVEFGVESSGSEPLKVTICWTDPPGPIQPVAVDPTNAVLVNDLDVRVVSPDGSMTNMPWVLDVSSPSNAATTGDNVRDNVEQVYIESPTNGLYTVFVSHKGSLTNDEQDVSIFISGNIASNVTDLAIDGFIAPSTSIVAQVQWPAVVGSVYRISCSTNIVNSNGWEQCSDDICAYRETMTLSDLASTNTADMVVFYRVVQIK